MALLPPDQLALQLAALAPASERQGRQAAVAMAIDWRAGAPQLLLMRRRAHPGDPWSGQVSLPGGKAEPSDTDLVATSIRESREELAIDLAQQATHLGQLGPIQAMAGGKRIDMWITPCVFEVTGDLAPQTSAEAQESFWLPLAQAKAGDLDHRFAYQDSKRKLLLPAWRFQERVIWGLTFRMISSLLRDFPSTKTLPQK